MDRGAERDLRSDLFLLADEKFDFDVSLSPASSDGDEDEDEVFVGPVSHKEKFAAVSAASRPEAGGAAWGSWHPLSGDQLQEMCQEAHRLADQLQCSELSEDAATTVAADGFVRGAEAKLGVLCQAALSPIKRQTFCVQDSPMKQLPPAVQRRLQRGSGANTPTSTRPAATSTRPATKAAAAAASPVAGVKPLPRTGLRGRAALSVAVVLPSKPVATTTTTTTTSCPAGRGGAEKPRMHPPSRPLGSWRRSPSCSAAAGSCEDLLSDSASVASDVSDSSLNASLLGKRTLAPPTKRALMNPSGVKAPPLQRRRMTERKNTSSSSSSVSSFNSSLSLSPAAGKLNSLNRSQSGSTGPAPISRPRRSTAYAPAEPPASSTAGRRCSLSTQPRKLSEAERVKAARPAALKRAEATPLPLTPAKRVLERAASIPAATRLQSGLKAKSKPEASTPGGGGRHGDAPDVSEPKRVTSVSGVDSLPQTPSAASCRSRRPSALPTPVRRRMSSIPIATPTRPPPTFDPASARSERSCSPAPVHTQEAELVDVHPFCLEEEEEPPAAPPPASPPPQPDQSESTDPGAPHQGGSEPIKNLIELETTEESKTQEVLLVDLPAPTLRPQEKLLIDLTNSPDLIRTSSNTCTGTQLIDLSSPLIKWSPDEKRENNAPLINLSF